MTELRITKNQCDKFRVEKYIEHHINVNDYINRESRGKLTKNLRIVPLCTDTRTFADWVPLTDSGWPSSLFSISVEEHDTKEDAVAWVSKMFGEVGLKNLVNPDPQWEHQPVTYPKKKNETAE